MKPYYEHAGISVFNADCLKALSEMPDASVNCCVTSPPYWGLRDYGHAGQVGLEETPDAYVAALSAIFAQVRRVLAPEGTLWLNLGDSYTGSGKGGGGKQDTNIGSLLCATVGESARKQAVTNVSRRLCTEHGMKPKDLVGIPWRVAFALQSAGWYLRSDIIAAPRPVARENGCGAIIVELNPEYCELIKQRLEQEVFNFEA